MNISIVIIGDEMLLGRVTDTNSGSISRAFNLHGWETARIFTVGDDASAIREAVDRAMEQSEVVVMTGGLGPTKDDITKGVLTDVFGGETVYNEDVAENIREIFKRRGLELNELTERQAIVPESCRVIQNRYGTAPIMWFERDNRVLVAMPGVPFETEGMLPEVVAQVCRRFSSADSYSHRTLIVGGISESALAMLLNDFELSLAEGMHLAYLPQAGYVRLRLDAKNVAGSVVDHAYDRLKYVLGNLLLCEGDATPAQMVLELMKERGLTLATAESCTGGNIARSIISNEGASEVFSGSIVSYSNSVKANVLGVGTTELDNFGAVSQQVVEQMVEGVGRLMNVDCAIATSGIAGPGGGTPQKPVGTVWMAWKVGSRIISKVHHFAGDRNRVIERATNEALIELYRLIKGAN